MRSYFSVFITLLALWFHSNPAAVAHEVRHTSRQVIQGEFQQRIDRPYRMEISRPYLAHFKQHAFKWKEEFGKRHEGVYGSLEESRRYVERQGEGAPSKEDIIDRFVHTQCQQDINRYLYRSLLLEGFLEPGDLEMIREPLPTENSTANVLMEGFDGRYSLNSWSLSWPYGGSPR